MKRVELIIAALALLPESLQVDWHHFGDGVERAALTGMAKKTLPPNIQWKFWGSVSNRRLAGFYQVLKPDLFITASSTEGLPISILEAFSASVPAVATAVGGIPEIVRDGKTGFLLPENPSAGEIAGIIQRFYNLSSAKKEFMGMAARNLWEECFDAEKNAERFAEILKHVLSS